MNVLIKKQRKDLRSYIDVLRQSKTNLEQNLPEDSFIENIINILDIDKEVGALIFQELASAGEVTGEKFIDYASKFDSSLQKQSEELKEEEKSPVSPQKATKEEFNPTSFVQNLEESKFPIFNLLDSILFNENGKIPNQNNRFYLFYTPYEPVKIEISRC